jgi:oligopeptide transport system permease protein
MLRFIGFRLLQAIPVLFVVITATFFLVRFAPGGPFSQEKAVIPVVKAALEAQYHLDQPLLVQYGTYLNDLLHGDLGPSFKYPGRSVNELIAAGFPVTAELGLYAMLIAVLLGMGAGLMAALHPHTWRDYLPMSAAMTGICMPTLLLGPVLVLVFGVWLEWVPVSGWGDVPGDKILPSLTLGAAYAAYVARLTRGGMLEVMSQDYIRTARAKGLLERLIIRRHELKNAMLPVVTVIGIEFAFLMGGLVVTEQVFNLNGLGKLFVESVTNYDYTMTQALVMVVVAVFVLTNFLVDVLYAWLDPRIRYK